MRHVLALLLMFSATGCGTSRSTAPETETRLAAFDFSSIRATPVQLRVLDRRGNSEGTEEWVARVTNDLTSSLTRSGVQLSPTSPTIFEVKLILLRADFENRQWKGCAKLVAEITRAGGPVSAEAESCTTKANLWGYKTADNVMKLAYQDALAEMLARLESRLR